MLGHQGISDDLRSELEQVTHCSPHHIAEIQVLAAQKSGEERAEVQRAEVTHYWVLHRAQWVANAATAFLGSYCQPISLQVRYHAGETEIR